jgi:glycosyltransferase involved in cell wall biosynthesis
MATDQGSASPGLVSIVMPSYNRAELTKRALESVLAQTYKNFQLILVDDGSKDHTRQVFERMPGVEYHYRVNGGEAKATNTGLALAKGEFIALLDSDDWWGRIF